MLLSRSRPNKTNSKISKPLKMRCSTFPKISKVVFFFYLFDSYNIYYNFFKVRKFRIVELKYVVRVESLSITAEYMYMLYFSNLGIKLTNYLFCTLQKLPPKISLYELKISSSKWHILTLMQFKYWVNWSLGKPFSPKFKSKGYTLFSIQL